MNNVIKTDICVIGAGSGGLSVAAGASQMGADVVLIEKSKMGGDCLNTGCVPSKSLIAAAHAAHVTRTSARYGVNGHEPEVRFDEVNRHVHGVIAAIAPHDSVDRFEGLGVNVIQAAARFVGPNEIEAGDTRIRARRFVIATGSSAATPDIPGLSDIPYLTNESIFEVTERPDHLIVIGGGPIGSEMAQAHRRLGSRVTVVQYPTILPKDDPEAVAVVRRQFRDEGIELIESVMVKAAEPDGNGYAVLIEDDGEERRITGSHVLVAAGRAANVGSLNLEAAGIDYTPRGIKVDDRLRTSNRRVFAIGDVAGGYQFTHMAAYHAGIVIRNALFRLPAKVDYRAVPWVTYTTPELAHVGMGEEDARKAHGEIRILRFPFAENDRARAERETDGLVKVLTTKKGVVVGASIVGPHAGELIQSWILPISKRMHIKHMAGVILPYPTLGEVNKRAAGSFYTSTLFSDRTRKIVKFLAKFG